MKSIVAVIFALLLGACSKAPPVAAGKHYHFKGKVVSLNPAEQTAAIASEAIPNYMEAMTMDYPVKSKSEFASLRVGETIQATINVSDDGVFDLSQISAAK